ncbi:MAG: carboxypeptidase regulatory-like domain-containing protein, partial [Bryobacteraceae bacterium]
QPDFRNPLVQKWNAVVQRELPGQMSLEVGYEGNHQSHQVILWNADPAANIGTTNSAITTETRREIVAACPACTSVGNGLSTTSSFGYGNYGALSAKLEKRYSNGLQILAAYAWSHALANSGTPLSGAAGLGAPDPTNLASEYSTASWDIRHNFTAAFNYDIPFGKGKQFGAGMNRITDTIAGNWHVNGLLTLRTGQPYTLDSNQCQGVWGRCVPDAISGMNPNASPSGGRNPNEWFDINNVTAPASLTGGNLGLESQTGPPNRTLDFSIFKDFAITERWKVQFRAESFNLANTPQLSAPDGNIQDSLKYGGNGNFGRVTSSLPASERHIQFALRLQF